MVDKLQVAVITGSHPYDVINFQNMFKNYPDINIYLQHMEDFVTDTGNGKDFYDVILFYHMITETPGYEDNDFNQKMEQVLNNLGERGEGLFILHHSLVAFPEWETWSQICGVENRINDEVYEGVEMNLQIKNDSHYITDGLKSWKMIDEIYTIPDADKTNKNNILLTTDHEKSMKTIAWTRTYKKSRVFCLASGHDNRAFSNTCFKKVVKRGIEWTGRVE
ncbi:MAG: ThuA domain-containing protein [Halanaerobiaceae bacterium]